MNWFVMWGIYLDYVIKHVEYNNLWSSNFDTNKVFTECYEPANFYKLVWKNKARRRDTSKLDCNDLCFLYAAKNKNNLDECFMLETTTGQELSGLYFISRDVLYSIVVYL